MSSLYPFDLAGFGPFKVVKIICFPHTSLYIASFNHDRLTVEFNHNKCDESFSYQVVLDRTVGSVVHYWFHFYWIGESLSIIMIIMLVGFNSSHCFLLPLV